jgi:Zn-dependent peptidase ImmA (M78 family)/DNA-binding XRE family transcriptional regulator
MTIGTTGFIGSRLRQAREARSLSVIALAELVGVSAAAISQYENGLHLPRIDTSRRLAELLNLPLSYFLKPEVRTIGAHPIFYRSMSSATKQSRTRAERRFEWFKEMIPYFEEFLEFPEATIPDFGFPEDFRKITPEMIESAADQMRAYWRLGTGPIADMARTLEANGVYVTRSRLDADTLDAFSEFDGSRPYVFLNTDKNILVRSRFDCAHELGHIVLHRNICQKELNKASDFRIIENHAHHFGGAFLFPAKSFQDEIWGISLDSFRSLKARWKVSIAAMVSRASQLELIKDDEVKRMWINLNRRGWKRFEPLDDLPCEQPQMFTKAVDVLINNKIKTKDQILNDLRLTESDIVELLNLDSDFFKEGKGDDLRLKVRGDNVIPFKR